MAVKSLVAAAAPRTCLALNNKWLISSNKLKPRKLLSLDNAYETFMKNMYIRLSITINI